MKAVSLPEGFGRIDARTGQPVNPGVFAEVVGDPASWYTEESARDWAESP